VRTAWQIATGVDLQYPWAAEANPPDLVTRIGQHYLNRVAAAAPTSQAASGALLELTQLVVSPNAVFRPKVVAAALRRPRGSMPKDPPSTTHGAAAGRTRAASAPSIVGVSTSSVRSRPRAGSSASPPPDPGLPAGDERRSVPGS